MTILNRVRWRVTVAAVLAVHAAALAWSATLHSPTYGEIPALASGIRHWETGNFNLYRVNPPLVRMVAALPVVMLHPRTDWSRVEDRFSYRCEFDVGEDFIQINGDRALWLFTVARWACLPFSLLGGWVCYRWASELYGRESGLVSLILWCSCPMLLGHGQLITTDVPAASCGVLANYCFWRWLTSSSGPRTFVAGVSLGLALLVKTTWLVLLPLWPATWLVWVLTNRQRRHVRAMSSEGGQLAAILVIALLCINLGYTGERSFVRLHDMQFVSSAAGGNVDSETRVQRGANRFRGTRLATVPVPLPENYVLGIDVQRRDFEVGEATYFRGAWYDRGFPYYYAYAFLVKNPEGTLVLLILSVITAVCRAVRVPIVNELVLLAPGVAVFVLVSSQTGINSHFRYTLPAFPFILIYSSRAATASGRLTRGAAWALLACSVAGSAMSYPHGLSYFNATSGGCQRAPFHLLGSNIDWGQDALYLREWIHENKPGRLFVALAPEVNPHAVGIDFAPPPPDHRWPLSSTSINVGETGPQPGWYAVSVNRLYGRDGECRYLLESTPREVIGSSIYLYHFTVSEANRLRNRLGLPPRPAHTKSFVR